MILFAFTPHNDIIDIGRYIAASFAAIEICLGVWLSFSFASKEYKLCCNLQHKMLKQCCVNLTIRQLKTQQKY